MLDLFTLNGLKTISQISSPFKFCRMQYRLHYQSTKISVLFSPAFIGKFMNKDKWTLGFLVAIVLIPAISTAIFKSKYKRVCKSDNRKNLFTQVEASVRADCKNIILKIDNRSINPLTINWDKTLFIKDNISCGGVIFSHRNIKKQLSSKNKQDIILPNSEVELYLTPECMIDTYNIPTYSRMSFYTPPYEYHNKENFNIGNYSLKLSVSLENQEVNEFFPFEIFEEKMW